jgi:predicted anti-sigma-YlaC factor YlaD
MSNALLICSIDGKARSEAELAEHLEDCGACSEFIKNMAFEIHLTEQLKESAPHPPKKLRIITNVSELEEWMKEGD